MEGRSHSHGTAGASARREHERRKARREDAVRAQHPRIGKLMLAIQDAPQHERRWADGAGGEELVAAALEKRCRPEVVALHDRRLPGTRANIDHLVVAPSGVWVVDAKRVDGELPLVGTPEIKGFPLLHRRLLAKRLNADGPLDAAAVSAIAAALADRFPPA